MLLGFAIGVALATLGTLSLLATGWGKVQRLQPTAVTRADAVLPRVSVIVPARNEARGVRQAALSLLEQDYPDFELIMVDDRSTDATGEILDDLAQAERRLRVLHISELPADWLGKNHALWRGSREATGEWLLFTDADVVYHPAALRTAVDYAEARGLDHLTLAPDMAVRGYWLRAFVGFFLTGFLTWERPWLANNPRSRVGLGIGAFNLIRAQAYKAMGTHRALSLRPDDDMRLGMRVKRAGLRQGLALAPDLLQVEWYASLGEAVRGLEKNAFAALDYNVARVALSMLILFAIIPLPYLLLPFARGAALALLLLAIAGTWLSYAAANYTWGRSVFLLLPAIPVVSLVFVYTVLRSAWLALWRGGIRWRDTLYPLDVLRHQSGLD